MFEDNLLRKMYSASATTGMLVLCPFSRCSRLCGENNMLVTGSWRFAGATVMCQLCIQYTVNYVCYRNWSQ